MILYINCCVRSESRTDCLARAVLDKMGEYIELFLPNEKIKPLTEEMLNKRTSLLEAGNLNDHMFDHAHQFVKADKIVISAPFWDCSFPSLLKVYIENIYVVGIVSRYSSDGIPIYYAVKNRKLIPFPDDYLALPESFDLSPGDVISLDIRGKEDISLIAEQIQLFCRGLKIDNKTGMAAALCFEELAVNTIRFGFPKCKKHSCIDLRLVFTKDEMTMRLQDNCPMFDVERYLAQELSSADDKAGARLGLKIISGLVENISYVHSLENNNVIIRFQNYI